MSPASLPKSRPSRSASCSTRSPAAASSGRSAPIGIPPARLRQARGAAQEPGPIPRRGAQTVDAHHHALGAKTPAQIPDESRVLQRRGVDGHFLGAGVEHLLGVGHRADAAGNAERYVEEARHAPHPSPIHRAALRACGDVVEDELIGAGVAIARREVQDVPGNAMVAEAHALYDLAVAYVEARDDAAGKNGRNSSSLMRCSNSARPLTAAATPINASSARSAASRTPPEACHARSGKRASAVRYRSRLGPVREPSRPMSVHRTWRMPPPR